MGISISRIHHHSRPTILSTMRTFQIGMIAFHPSSPAFTNDHPEPCDVQDVDGDVDEPEHVSASERSWGRAAGRGWPTVAFDALPSPEGHWTPATAAGARPPDGGASRSMGGLGRPGSSAPPRAAPLRDGPARLTYPGSPMSAHPQRIAVFGAGYVGLVTGACFADLGHHVVVRDVLPERIDALRRGEVPIHEPGLARAPRPQRRPPAVHHRRRRGDRRGPLRVRRGRDAPHVLRRRRSDRRLDGGRRAARQLDGTSSS